MSSKKKSSNKQQKQQNKEIKKKSSGFPLKKIIFLLLVVLGGLIYVDVKNNGSWKDSRTALLLKEYKVCEYSHQVLNKTKGGINWVNSEIDKKFPGYEKNLHETLEPYLQVASDFGVLIKNAACDFKDRMIVYYNVVVAKIEKEAPSFSEKIKEMFGEKFSIEKISNVMIEGLTFIQKEVTEFCVVVWNKIRTFTT